jgi:hypothetical protein
VAGTPIEAEITKEVAANLADRHKGDPLTGAMRRVEVTDPETGAQRVEWRGDRADWIRAFMPPFQVATAIKTFDRRGNETPPAVCWGSPPPRRAG